jgi:tetratricopeptide (TPR) repeat protein
VKRLRPTRALAVALLVAIACAGPQEDPRAAVPSSEGISPLVAKAEAAIAQGDYDTAVAAYEEAYERTPWNERLRAHLVAAYAERSKRARARGTERDFAAAEKDLRAALELRPDDPVLRKNLALVLAERAARGREGSEQLRAEALALDPEVAASVPAGAEEIERRLDLAHDLVQRGQVEAGLLDLEQLFAEHADYPGVGRLYGQALVRHGLDRQEQGDYDGADVAFARAVAVYAALGACPRAPCEDPDVRAAHHDRIANWMHADRDDDARRALAEAEAAGLRFPDMRRMLGVAP